MVDVRKIGLGGFFCLIWVGWWMVWWLVDWIVG